MRLSAHAITLVLLAATPPCKGLQARNVLEAMEVEDGLAPQWYPADEIFKRQDNFVNCGRSSHSCLDVENGSICCANNQYCIVNRQGSTKCCRLGNLCTQETTCGFNTYECNATTTITTGATASTSTYSACCPRGCPTSSFRCPSSMGNGCCGYGEECATGLCLKFPTAAQDGFVPQATTECANTQVLCPTPAGGGCCDQGRTCTVVSSSALCAAAPTNTDSPPAASGGGLGTAATAGIAVGVVLGAAVIIGVITWMCIRKRRYGTASFRSNRTQTMSQADTGRHPDPNSIPLIIGGVGGGGAQHNATDAGGGVGPTVDYFGPDAVVGPYTDTDVGSLQTRRTTPGVDRGVPLDPMSPSHIVAPVELDPYGSNASAISPGSRQSYLDARSQMHFSTPPIAESAENRYELYGSTSGLAQLGTNGPQQETPYEDYLTPLETPGNYAGQGPIGHHRQQQQQHHQNSRQD